MVRDRVTENLGLGLRLRTGLWLGFGFCPHQHLGFNATEFHICSSHVASFSNVSQPRKGRRKGTTQDKQGEN